MLLPHMSCVMADVVAMYVGKCYSQLLWKMLNHICYELTATSV